MNREIFLLRRKQFDFTLDEVGELSGLSVDRIRQLEEGTGDALRVDEVHALADALAFDSSRWFRGEALDDPRRAVARFCADADARFPAADVRLLARAAELARWGEFLRTELGRPPSDIAAARRVKAVSRGIGPAFKQGYTLGEAARSKLACTHEPIVSLQALFEGWGLHVAQVAFSSSELHAVSLYEDGALPLILLNTRAPRASVRASRRSVLAHELCHLLHDGVYRQSLVTVISWHGERDAIEQRANGFAPAFLAPPSWLRPEGESPLELVKHIASRWGFTFEGAVWHAKNSHLIEPSTADLLQKIPPADKRVPLDRRFEAAIHRRALPESLEVATVGALCRGLIGDWAVEAFERDLISGGRARKLLSWA